VGRIVKPPSSKRQFDIAASCFLLLLSAIPMALIAALIKATSRGPVLHWSNRIGRGNVTFKMPKFRTMICGTPDVATHLLDRPESWVTPIGRFLRRLSLDELPQLFSVVMGQMSIVGPRPALFNQHDLIDLRTGKNIHRLLPGITGWAQVNGRDELPIPVKVAFEEQYLREQSLRFDVRILAETIMRVFHGSGVSH
ncbi:MAG TPA: sugar transferase, partial [Desulfobacterales bacterium]|nr:sugar transferase [Desulfobacterales bacterium]